MSRILQATDLDFYKLHKLADAGKMGIDIALITSNYGGSGNLQLTLDMPPDADILRKEKNNMPPFADYYSTESVAGCSDPLQRYYEIQRSYTKYASSHGKSGKTGKTGIKRVIFNSPMTIIIWDDETKTYARTYSHYDEDSESYISEDYDPYKGFLLCYAKKVGATKTLNKYKDFLFNKDSHGRYFIEYLIKHKFKDWNEYTKEVKYLYFEHLALYHEHLEKK